MWYVASDVDGTIADRVEAYKVFWQGKLGLWTPEELEGMRTYADLFRGEKFRTWKKANPDLLIQFYEESQQSLQVLEDCIPIPYAQGMLSQFQVTYYTIRKSRQEALSQQMEAVTRAWLNRHGFVGEVYFPFSFQQKILLIRKHARNLPIVFFDDRWKDVLTAYERLLIRYPDNKAVLGLQQQMTLVAFGIDVLPDDLSTHGLRVIPLPNWQARCELLSDLLPIGPS
ncbi:hypothetical protein [Ktedonobacter robiniae]|uniref:Haloacid dehalogenase n=1 Tax=Ktedonobacter robiniae TaxID=2778365 RepID=A0ABQ3V2Q8_9CHLR|nr:hypothetical protein [Ktedonobacter robiniae]GHO59242.1 hypothetical protein KSB_77170 [Ktedonobacter robiniae]